MDATTLVLAPPQGAEEVPPQTPLLGMPMIRRTVLAARRAGFSRVLVAGDSDPVRAALSGTGAEPLTAGTAAPAGALTLPRNVVVGVRELEAFRGGVADVGVAVERREDLRTAERLLLRGLVKDTEGFMSRHFDRKISLAISRRLAGTRVTPNQMTVVSTLIGVFGSLFFLSTRPLMETLGAVAFLFHSIVDGCDGELARLKFQESRRGGVLDFWGDNLVHVAVFAAIAIGWSRSAGAAWPLLLGASAILGTLASALYVYARTMRGPREGPLFTSVSRNADAGMARAADALARRDFIYLVLILSAFGRASWFLILAAAGAPLFFLALVGIAARERGRKTA